MSMIGNFLAISPDQLAAFKADPDSVIPFLYPDDEDAELGAHLDIDKAWHAIHYTLNGSAWEGEEPLFLVVLGGEEIGEDAGYGPARYLTPDEVRQVAAALSTVGADQFSERFSPAQLDAAEIYPQIWERDGAEGLEYVLFYYNQLVSFYGDAAKRGDAVLAYLN